jgi:Cu-Zn family superoxide dismutase
MKRLTVAFALGVAAALSASAQEKPTGTTGAHPRMASASLADTEGRAVGQAQLRQTPHGVLLRLDLKNATPGVHAMHIHDAGRCDRPSFESAGPHFNPGGHQHGLLNPRGVHAGDLPNLDIPASQQLSVEYLVVDVTLDPGPQSLLDANGSAIVIHSGKDDYASDPAGASGDRIACGQISQSEGGTR